MVGAWRHTTGVKFKYFGDILKDQRQKQVFLRVRLIHDYHPCVQASKKAQPKTNETEDLRASVQRVMAGKPGASAKEVAQAVIEKIQKSKGMK